MSTADQLFPSEDEVEEIEKKKIEKAKKRSKPTASSSSGSTERGAPPPKKGRSMPRLSPIPAPRKATAQELFGTDSEDEEQDEQPSTSDVLLYLLFYATEIKANTRKEINPRRNLKKQPERVVLPDKSVNIKIKPQKKSSKPTMNVTANVAKNSTKNATDTSPPRRLKYKDYIRKFDATAVYERIERRYKRKGINVSRDEIYEEVMNQIDPVDELLKFQPGKGDWRVLFGPQYRRAYLPPGTFFPREQHQKPNDYDPRQHTPDTDKYGVRPRIYELMKQVIYQSRDKMTIMQKWREELNQTAVFRLGYLFGKTDQAIKDYHSTIYKSHYLCSAVRSRSYDQKKFSIMEVLTSYERAVMHWFEAELLWDLVIRNDRICKEVIAKQHTDRKEVFNKVFVV